MQKYTLERYENAFKKHIVKNIGNMRLQEFSPKIMKIIFKEKFSYLSFRNKGIVVCVLRKIFDYAICDELFTGSNPMQAIKHKQKEYAEPKRLNKLLRLNEVISILKSMNTTKIDNKLKIYFQLALLTEMMVNEILALKYDDIDLENSIIKVYKSLKQGRNKHHKNKTGTRNIEILPFLNMLLKDTLNTNRREYIFLNKRDKFISETTIRKHFNNILQSLSIEQRTLYSTRHTFASIMIAYG